MMRTNVKACNQSKDFCLFARECSPRIHQGVSITDQKREVKGSDDCLIDLIIIL